MPQSPGSPNTPRSADAASWQGSPQSPADPSPHTDNGPQTIYDEENMNNTLPRLHLCSYRGDLTGVLQCITDGHSVHDTVVMRNQAGRLVCGITPLFLAAQRGHYKVVKLLVGNGSNPAQPAFIQGSADLCTPVQVARLNFNVKVTYYLSKAVAARKAEDKVLKQEEEEIGAARNAIPDALGNGAQHVALVNLGDLSGWDPTTGDQPPVQNENLIKRIFKKPGVNLEKWHPDVERTKDGDAQMKASQSRVVDLDELQACEVANHGPALTTFLRDADLATWDPYEGSMKGAAPSSVAATRRVSMELDGMAGSNYNSRANSPGSTREYSNGVPATLMHRAAGAPAARAPAQAQVRARPVPSSSSRWYAHGDSDSDEEEEHFEASASVPAAPPVTTIRG